MPILPFRARTKMRRPNPTEVPLYGVAESARWVGVPVSTFRKWIYGRDYPAGGTIKRSEPLIDPADPEAGLLSFANIAEAHILDATRRARIPMADVRAALDMLERRDPTPHPLLSGRFLRFGKRLFVDFLTEKVAASKPIEGQPVLDHLLDEYLERIERDNTGRVFRLFPMRHNARRDVVLDFNISGGQPVVAGTGILVEFLYERTKAGESVAHIAADYGLSRRKVAEAIQFIAA